MEVLNDTMHECNWMKARWPFSYDVLVCLTIAVTDLDAFQGVGHGA